MMSRQREKELLKELVDIGCLRDSSSNSIDLSKLKTLIEECGHHGSSRHIPQNETNYYRQNTTSNYPFTDDISSVSDTLKENIAKSHNNGNSYGKSVGTDSKLISMGKTSRNRLVSKVFDDFKVGVKHMLVRNIIEALQHLGIALSPSLEGIIKQYAESFSSANQRVSNKIGKPLEAAIDLDQWYLIVNRCLWTKQSTIPLASSHQSMVDECTQYDDDSKYASYLLSSSKAIYHQRPQVSDDIADIHATLDECKDGKSSSRLKQTGTNRKTCTMRDDAKSRRRIQSRIKTDVDRDRTRFKAIKSNQNTAALHVIAKARVQQLTCSKSDDSKLRTDSINNQKNVLKSLQDPTSGMATLSIASTFLKSKIADDFVDSDTATSIIADVDAYRNETLNDYGIYLPSRSDECFHTTNNHDPASDAKSFSVSAIKKQTLAEPVWKASRCGWVGNF